MLHDSIGDFTGGSGESTLRFAELLKKRGHKIIFIGSRCPGKKKIDYWRGIKRYRAPSIPFQKEKSRNFYLALPSGKYLENIFKKENIQILHVAFPFVAAVRSIAVARKMGIKVIIHSHFQPENFFLNVHKSLNNSNLNKIMYNYIISLYKKADIIVCPSKFAEKSLKSRNNNFKTIVISNGVDLSKFKLTKQKKSKKFPKLLFTGRFDPEKNIDTLIRAVPILLEKFPNLRADLVGGGSLIKKFRRLVKKLKIRDYVKIHGKISSKELIKRYAKCDIFVQPSQAELEGMVILEALACGKPVVVANSKESAARFLVKKNGLLFKLKDSQDLAKKITFIAENKKVMKEMHKNALSFIRNFDINASITKMEGVYNYVLRKKSKPVRIKKERKGYKELVANLIKIAKSIDLMHHFNKNTIKIRDYLISLTKISISFKGK